jgi:alginate O-acetyltransferase complex protein AlgI
MLFNSIEFFFFFIVVTTLYFLLPVVYRCMLLLIASCYFYMAFVPYYILILFFTIIIDYFAGLWIEREQDQRKRKRLLLLSLIANIGVLVVFKYYNFFIDNISAVLAQGSMRNPLPYLTILLPIGLSFHTFQAMSYTIEVYRGNQVAEKRFSYYALYVMYYPQLVAGPIERPQNILPQMHFNYKFDYDRVTSGLRQMLWGLFKKVVIADRLSLFVDAVYGDVHSYQGFPLIWACLFFTFQIYCDFSGYSDIALGASRVMGLNLMVNFKRPYLSTSISEFWSRWHISLSSWFRDYVYIPLGGNRVGKVKWLRNLFIVFIISGFWHGANWTFIVWGALHGFYLIMGVLTKGFQDKLRNLSKSRLYKAIFKFVEWSLVILLVVIGWVFFRAANISDALYVLQNAYKIDLNYLIGVPVFSYQSIALSFLLIFFVLFSDWYFEKRELPVFAIFNKRYVKYAIIFLLCLAIYLFGVFEKQNFIYFQF